MRTIILTLTHPSETVSKYLPGHVLETGDGTYRYTVVKPDGWSRCKKFLLGYISREGLRGDSLYMGYPEMGKRVIYTCEGGRRIKVDYESLYLSYESEMDFN